MINGLTLTATVLNSPDPVALAHFHQRLLGWEITSEDPGWAMLANPDGGVGLSLQIEDIHERPVWPAKFGTQQMMLHLDIQVEDLEGACAHARACGATLADDQPQEDVRVHLDPDGHPFCLYL